MGIARYSSHWSPHNPEAAGSSPAPAITDHSEMSGFLFLNRVTGHRQIEIMVFCLTFTFNITIDFKNWQKREVVF